MQIEDFNMTSSSSSSCLGRWTLLKQLGSGATSKVYLGVDNSTQERAAIKIFTAPSNVSKGLLKIESHVLKTLSHSNILRFIESYESVDFYDFESGSILNVSALVMEYAVKGEFFDTLERCGVMSENQARVYFSQLASAISHMHTKNIAHRDIKLENILLDERNNIKLADFGYASPISSGKLFKNAVGTSAYFAPEIHASTPYSGESADIFAAGIILFTMITGHMPFGCASTSDRVYNLIINGDFKTFWAFHEKMSKKVYPNLSFSEELKDLLNQIFKANPNERASMDEVTCHPWMQGKITSSVY